MTSLPCGATTNPSENAERDRSSAHVLVVVLSRDGSIERVSPALEGLSGYSAAEVQGKAWSTTFLGTGNPDRLRPLMHPAQGDATVTAATQRLRTRDGRIRLVEWQRVPADGGVGICLVGRDVTAAQDAIDARHHRRYEAMGEGAGDAILIVRRDGTILDANPAAASYGYQPDELRGGAIRDLLAADAPDLTTDEWQQAELHGLLFESIHRRKDGGTFPVEVSASGATLDGERVLVHVVRDITSRKRVEAGLRARTQQLEDLQSLSAELSRELDLTALLNLVLQRAVEFVGAESGSLFLWDDVAERLTPVTWTECGDWVTHVRPRLGEGLMGLAAELRRGIVVNDYRRSSYADPYILERTSVTATIFEPLCFRDRLVGMIVANHHAGADTFSDTDREKLLLLANQAAPAIANARSFAETSTTYHALQRVQETARQKEKLQALGRMAAGINHELNNKLTIILGQAELLRRSASGGGFQAGLETLHAAASESTHTLRRLQDFARLTPRRPLTACDVRAIAYAALELTRPRWQEATPQASGITVWTALDDVPHVLGDPTEIREVLTNLILNAVESMPAGGSLTLTGSIEPMVASSEESHWVTLTVSDTGAGMSDEVRERLFEPFCTTKGFQRTGLGLAAVYGIMARHGGRVDINSQAGKGTVVTLRFQRARQPEATTPELTVSTPPAPRRLLLIDDEESVRSTTAALLRSAGHEVVEAASGSEGLRRLSDQPVDVVITDLGMPGMTGWDVAHQIKTSHPRLPVVLLTAWDQSVTGSAPEQAYTDRIVGKPIQLEELQGAIAGLTAGLRP